MEGGGAPGGWGGQCAAWDKLSRHGACTEPASSLPHAVLSSNALSSQAALHPSPQVGRGGRRGGATRQPACVADVQARAVGAGTLPMRIPRRLRLPRRGGSAHTNGGRCGDGRRPRHRAERWWAGRRRQSPGRARRRGRRRRGGRRRHRRRGGRPSAHAVGRRHAGRRARERCVQCDRASLQRHEVRGLGRGRSGRRRRAAERRLRRRALWLPDPAGAQSGLPSQFPHPTPRACCSASSNSPPETPPRTHALPGLPSGRGCGSSCWACPPTPLSWTWAAATESISACAPMRTCSAPIGPWA